MRVNEAFGQTEAGPVMPTVTAAEIDTDALPVELHEPEVTLTPRATLPEAPAVKVMALVPWPAVMVPLVMVQA